MNVVLKMKVVLNMKELQLPGLLEALGGGTSRIENIVIDAKEIDTKKIDTKKEEFKKGDRDLTTEDLLRIQEVINQDGNGKDAIFKRVPGVEE